MTSNSKGPLDGVRVVEFAGQGPAPYAAMVLADLGADVIRIDRPATGDEITMDPRFNLLNRGKRSIALDLRTGGGKEVAAEVIRRSDILIEGFRPGVMERLGFGPDDALELNPRLVYGRMTGWGQTGPYRMAAGHDISYIAVTGALHAIGDDRGPQIPLNLIGDFGGGGTFLVIGVLAALRESQLTAKGQVVDVAIVDGASHLTSVVQALGNAGRWTDQRSSNLLDGGCPFYTVYETSDGRHVSVGALEPKFFAGLIRGLNVDFPVASQYDRSRWPQLYALIAGRVAERTQEEWMKKFDGTDACVAPILSLREAPADPHVKERGSLIETPDGIQPGVVPRMSNHDLAPPELLTSPAPGEHTSDVLAELGMDADTLLESGAAATATP
ncbi:CaiB/BaiF CoA transferase family protein [Nocardioides sp. NPDC051685]|uniref:CaiB/BaiF CoA transferase family protein n=1 Tax=Nocardioides sp. NPDC051685 TaxID=3364334 RepID=UPI0037A7E991